MIKTIQEYALENGKSQQSIRQSKTLMITDLPIFALYKGEYIEIGSQKFIEVENNLIDNQIVIK